MNSDDKVNFTEEPTAATNAAITPSDPAAEAGAGTGSGPGASEEEGKDTDSLAQLTDLYEESLKQYQEGEVVSGRIVAIDKDYIIVDIGYKCEGHIPIQEFVGPNGEITAKVGDQVDVLLERRDDEEDVILLSKEKASKIKIWEEISRAYQEDGEIEGTIVAKVKAGCPLTWGA